MEFMIPISMFGAVVLIIWFAVNAQFKRRQMEHKERMLAIEKGDEIPPSLIEDRPSKPKYHNPYKAGLVWIAVGIGLAFHGFLFPAEWEAGPGLYSVAAIPLFIGIALLIANVMNQKRLARERKEQEGMSSVKPADTGDF
jgi:preprotein translocase subunit YajC